MIRSLGPQHPQHTQQKATGAPSIWPPTYLHNIDHEKATGAPFHLAPITGKKKHATLCPSIMCTLQYFLLTLVNSCLLAHLLIPCVEKRGQGGAGPRKNKNKKRTARPFAIGSIEETNEYLIVGPRSATAEVEFAGPYYGWMNWIRTGGTEFIR